MYTTALSYVISKFDDIKHHLYADDTQIYFALFRNPRSSRVSEIGPGLDGEFITCGTPDQRDSLPPFYSVNILGSLIDPSDCV